MARHEVRWCFHTTAMVADYERSRDVLARLIGCRPLEDHNLTDPAIGRRGGMTWIGDNSLELGEPSVPGGAVDQFLARFGSHMSSIAVQVADIDATVAHLESVGVRIASRTDDVIVFTSPGGTEGVVFEWYGGESENDPRFGTEIPPYSRPPLLDVTHMAFGGAVVRDPIAAAARLAEVCGTTVTFTDPQAPDGEPMAGVSLGDCTLALYPVPDAATSERVWGHTYTKPQTCNLGLKVPDLAAARAALEAEAVPLVRADERSLVIGEDVTGGVIVVVVDQLLPGDPRVEVRP